MAELKNTFSWSVSARESFAECPRRRYWSKYAMWNGWQDNATSAQRTAYRLNKMDNRFTIQGNAVERAVMWLLAETRAGRPADMDAAYTQIARPYLNQCWRDSRSGAWRSNPKKHCCLHEHYYPEHHKLPEPEMTARMIATVKSCVTHFVNGLLPALAKIPLASDLPVATVGAGGDPESFLLDEIKVYAIPDYACRTGTRLDIYDWKSGQARVAHKDQMAVYGLWAHRKHKTPPDQITVHLEYLAAGKSLHTTLTAADMNQTAGMIRQTVGEMAEYLEGGDLHRNLPLPCEEWEMSAEMRVCRMCNFYELCKKELEAP